MTTRTGTRRRLPHWDRAAFSQRALVGAMESGVGFLLGGVLAGAEIFGLYAPFGVAAVAAAGSGLAGFCTLAGAALGYLCLEGLTDGMRYAAAAILTYSVAFAFYDTRLYRTAFFMPGIACLLSALTGIITRAGAGWYGTDLVYFVTEVLFTGAAAWCYRIVFTQWPETVEGLRRLTARQEAGVLMLGATVLMSLARVQVVETFSLGRLLAAVGVMLCARRGAGAGVLTGACAGVALDLASGEPPYFSMVYAMAGLLCGLCKDHRKLLAAAVYAGASSVAVLWTWGTGVGKGLPLEATVAAVAFVLLPLRLPAGAEQERGPRALSDGKAAERAGQAATRRLEQLSTAFHGLCDSLKEGLRPTANAEDPAEVFTRTADRLCRKCVLSTTCWQREYEATRGALNDATQAMLARGRVLVTDLPARFAERCVQFPAFVAEANRQLTAFLRRRQERRRSAESRLALCSQFERIDRYLQGAAAELSAELTPDLPRQERLSSYLRSLGLDGGTVYYDRQGHLRVEVPADGALTTPAARRELSQVLGTALGEGEEADGRLRFAQAEPFRATAAVAGASRMGEEVSGDTGVWFRREDGTVFFLLCDGMGSGPEARDESRRAAGLIESFLRAGMEPEPALETVAAALALRGAGSTTVDLLAVDLFTGRCRVCKQGAAPTYLRRVRQIRCAAGTSLPAGTTAGEGSRADVHQFKGAAGDWIVLMTDGVLCGRDDGWVRDLLAGYEGESPGDLAGRLIGQAEQRHAREDDATVIAVHLERAREPRPHRAPS